MTPTQQPDNTAPTETPPPTRSSSHGFGFGTKAETLDRLRPLLRGAMVPESVTFRVADYRRDASAVLAIISKRFDGRQVAVRSSAQDEDDADSSRAGEYASCLDVAAAHQESLAAAIEQVVESYDAGDGHQVLVQAMVENIGVSGVITTHVLDDGAPYYVLNYDDESGRTDTITGGTGANKTVLVYRGSPRELIESARVARWIDLIVQLEGLCGDVPLDVEFAEDRDGCLHVLQVRQLASRSRWKADVGQRISRAQGHIEEFLLWRSAPRPGLVGSRTILGEMPDWNPAEIIGTSPRPLAVSLYRHLITDSVWRLARQQMGYRHAEGEVLMVTIGGRPFIDVRNSFNSLLPAGLREDVATTLVDAWLDRLDGMPQLHDKVEFEVAQTAIDLSFAATFQERYAGLLSIDELGHYRDELTAVTRRAVEPGGGEGSLDDALERIEALRRAQVRQDAATRDTELADLHRAGGLLEQCRELGTLPFSVIARHAFIAEALLRSAVRRGALAEERLRSFRRSLCSVTGELSRDMRQFCEGEIDVATFLGQYGHLRPGTYDILSLRYDQRSDLFDDIVLPRSVALDGEFTLAPGEAREVSALLQEAGLGNLDAERLLQYAGKAILGRERAKFTFSRSLSDALEAIASWGERVGLTREDLSYLRLETLLDQIVSPVIEERRTYFTALADVGRRDMEVTRSLQLTYLIRDPRDLFVIPLHRDAPNFVTSKRVEGGVTFLHSQGPLSSNLRGAIVCIENADPGFDWIFTRGIVGLITRYGGSNSHMAIRCAEFALPAAIGCGEQTFDRVVAAGRVDLNCSEQIVRPLHG